MTIGEQWEMVLCVSNSFILPLRPLGQNLNEFHLVQLKFQITVLF